MESKKQDIVRTAARLFSEKGYANTSVDEIAKESGIAKASFYKLFPSKEELLQSSLALYNEELRRRFRELVADRAGTPKERLIRYIAGYLACTFENKIHMLLFTETDAKSNESLAETCAAVECNLNALVKACLLDVYGERVEPYVWDIAFLMRGVAVEYMRVHASRDSAVEAGGLAAFIADVVELAANGLAAKGAAYEPFWPKLPWFCHPGENDAQLAVFRLTSAMRAMERTIAAFPEDDEEKEEYAQVLRRLHQEALTEDARLGPLKAYLAYLERRDALRPDCETVRTLLSMRSDREQVE